MHATEGCMVVFEKQFFMTAMIKLGVGLLSLVLLLTQEAMSAAVSNRAPDKQATEGKILSFDHLRFYVGNAKQAAYYWCVKFGFRPSAYSGLETGNRDLASHVITQGDITLVFQSSLVAPGMRTDTPQLGYVESLRDTAFIVDDVDAMFKKALAGGARPIRKPYTLSDPNDGEVRLATVSIVADYTHTFVDRSRFSGIFLPGYGRAVLDDALMSALPNVGLTKVDFVTVATAMGSMDKVIESYKKALGFHDYVFMIVDPIHTEDLQELAAVFLSNDDQSVVMTFAEPLDIAPNHTHFLDEMLFYNGGTRPIDTGFLTDDLIKAVRSMRQRGETFVDILPDYYDDLRARVKASSANLNFDIDELQSLDIVLDFSDDGKSYSLDIFTAMLQDIPTYFFILKQRAGNMSYSVNNYSALYNAVERMQDERGNL